MRVDSSQWRSGERERERESCWLCDLKNRVQVLQRVLFMEAPIDTF